MDWDYIVTACHLRFEGSVTRKELEAYVLVHPDFGGLNQRAAAQLLQVTQQEVYRRLAAMRRRFPAAFQWQHTPRQIPRHKIVRYGSSLDHLIVTKF